MNMIRRYISFIIVWMTGFLLLMLPGRLQAFPKFDINEFIADIVTVSLPVDSFKVDRQLKFKIIDDRSIPGPILGIQTSKKWKYIPVDQYIVIQNELGSTLGHYFLRDSVDMNGSLYIKNLYHWYDGSPALSKGRKLNAYTVLEDSSGNIVSDWIWEFTLKPAKKEKSEFVIGKLMDLWLTEQVKSVQNTDFHQNIYPYLYRRQFMNWWDLIILRDGYILNGHLTLDFPADQQESWVRGSPGIFYRKGRHHQSIAFGGKDQQWYTRLNQNLVRRINVSYRFGFNNFDPDKYEHLDVWNVLLVNFSANASIEYRPIYLKGLFLGLGLHASINVLPEVIDRVEPGILFTVGIILP